MFKREKLAVKINEYVAENGTETVMDTDSILALAELYDSNLKPTDYCYNYVNSRVIEKYDSIQHLFEYVGKNKFRLLGEKYPYTGDLIQYFKSPKDEPAVVGKWDHGIFKASPQNAQAGD